MPELVVTVKQVKPKDKDVLKRYEVTVEHPVILRGGRLTGRSVRRNVKVKAQTARGAKLQAKASGYGKILKVRRGK